MKRFVDRTVIITGSARGMGASHARGFVAEGANVVIADVLEQKGRTLADELGNQAIFSGLDVTSEPAPSSSPTAVFCSARCRSTRAPSCQSELLPDAFHFAKPQGTGT